MASYTIKDTAPVVQAFAKANIKQPLLSILPYVLICGMITNLTDKSHPIIGALAQLGTFYFSSLYASNIHRAFLHGVPAARFDPFRPLKDDWRFIGALALLAVIVSGPVLILFAVGSHFFPGLLLVILVLACGLAGIWLGWRLVLILPDRAIGGHLKPERSFELTKGIVLKMILTPIAASWVYMLAAFGWIIMAAIIGTGIVYFANPASFTEVMHKDNPLVKLFLYVLMAPGAFGFTYFYSTASVATLSNYYLWVKENRV